jgi:hypothetical protein
MNLDLGIVMVVGPFRVGVINTAINAIAINSNGGAYASGAGALYGLDLSSGALTFIAPTAGVNETPILAIGGILVLAGAACGVFSLIRGRRSGV